MRNIEKELRDRVKGFGEMEINFVDYVSMLKEIFESENIEKNPAEFAKIIENYFADEIIEIESVLKGFRFDDAREKSALFFDKFNDNLDSDFAKEVIKNLTNISPSEKNIFLAILGNENGIADFIANKCKEIKDLGSAELKESVEEFMLSDRMHEMLSKRIALNADEASYYLFFDYVRQQVLPNMNHESAMKFYLYVESGNFFKDLKEDESFNKVFLNENKDILIKTLFEKIKSRQYPLKLVHDNKESDYTAKIQVQKLPESYIEKPNRTSPSGYIDYAIFDADNPNILHIINVKASTIESDIYEHDEKSVVLDRSLKYWARTNGYTLVIHESQGSHKKEKLMKHFISEAIGELNDIQYKSIKKVLDTVINKLVDAYTGTEKNIIQPGDCKYTSKELKEKNAYEVFVQFTKLINDDILKINSSNSSIFKMTSKSIKWLSKIILKDPDFLMNPESVAEIRQGLKGLRAKFVEKDTIADEIKRLLSDTTPDVIDKKIKEARLNKLERNVAEEKNYYKSLEPLDFISDSENEMLDKIRERIFNFASNLSKEFIRFEKDNRINATKMSNIKEKYTLIFRSPYAVKSLTDFQGDKVYFTNSNFKASSNYQKDIESAFKLTQYKDGVFNTVAIEKVLSRIIKDIESDVYLDNFDSDANAGLVGGTKIFFMSRVKEKMISEAKKIIKEVNEIVPAIKRTSNDKFKNEVEGVKTILSEKSIKIEKFLNDSYDEGFIDMGKLIELENDVLKSKDAQIPNVKKNKAS